MNKKFRCVLFFGQHGTGKGTQIQLIAKNNKKYFHFSSGEALRSVDPNTELGKHIRSLIDQRRYLSDEIVFNLFDNTMKKAIEEGKFNPETDWLLLDGIPYTDGQANMLNERVDVKQIIHYFVDDDTILVNRLLKRGKLYGRKDDRNEEVIRKGFEIYEKETSKPLRKFDPSIIIKVDASGKPEEVHEKTIKHLIK